MPEIAQLIGVASLLIGLPLFASNVWVLARPTWSNTARYVSPIPLLSGAAIAIGMACFPSTRAWLWLPLALDPAGVLALGVAMWSQRQRRG